MFLGDTSFLEINRFYRRLLCLNLYKDYKGCLTIVTPRLDDLHVVGGPKLG